MKGYVQIYTGDGKCKTTAALGLAVRAVGAGLRVYLGQFIKAGCYSEIAILRDRFPEVTVEQYGQGKFVIGPPDAEDLRLAREGFERLRQVVQQGRHDVVIADEATSAVAAGLLSDDDLLTLMREKPGHVELVITGRGASPRLQAAADLVTDMKCVKHYFDVGVQGRPGIES